MSPETEREPAWTDAAARPASEFYFPAGGGTDPDFSPRADRDDAPGRFSRWLHSHPFAGRRTH